VQLSRRVTGRASPLRAGSLRPGAGFVLHRARKALELGAKQAREEIVKLGGTP
jgi:hypothetical protein